MPGRLIMLGDFQEKTGERKKVSGPFIGRSAASLKAETGRIKGPDTFFHSLPSTPAPSVITASEICRPKSKKVRVPFPLSPDVDAGAERDHRIGNLPPEV